MGKDAYQELEELLREEREAIKRLDGARVVTFAARKEALVASIRAAGPLSPESAARLRALGPALRHNTVLLAHARAVLRDAIAATRAEVGAPLNAPGRGPSAAAPRMISVRG